jgi:hypothetical protein
MKSDGVDRSTLELLFEGPRPPAERRETQPPAANATSE